jgi:hypothetical protein
MPSRISSGGSRGTPRGPPMRNLRIAKPSKLRNLLVAWGDRLGGSLGVPPPSPVLDSCGGYLRWTLCSGHRRGALVATPLVATQGLPPQPPSPYHPRTRPVDMDTSDKLGYSLIMSIRRPCLSTNRRVSLQALIPSSHPAFQGWITELG